MQRIVLALAAALSMAACATLDAAEEHAGGAVLRGRDAPAGAMWVEAIGLERFSQRRGTPHVGRTIRDKPIRLGGVEYPHGIGTRSISEFVVDLRATRRAAIAVG